MRPGAGKPTKAGPLRPESLAAAPKHFSRCFSFLLDIYRFFFNLWPFLHA
jgi:hypothetical protein